MESPLEITSSAKPKTTQNSLEHKKRLEPPFYLVSLEKLKSIDFANDWSFRVVPILHHSVVQMALSQAKQDIVEWQQEKYGRQYPQDVSVWPVLMLTPVEDPADQCSMDETLAILNSTYETAVQNYSNYPECLAWYLCNHHCVEMSQVYLAMAHLAYPDGLWRRCVCKVDGAIHITVADLLNRRLFDPLLWYLGWVE